LLLIGSVGMAVSLGTQSWPLSLDSHRTTTRASSKRCDTLWREVVRRKRRNHFPEFKAKVAMAAIRGDLTMAERVKKFDVHANQITDWKKQLLSNASDVFGKGAQKAEASAETVEQLHAEIGQLTMENDFHNAGSNGFTAVAPNAWTKSGGSGHAFLHPLESDPGYADHKG